VAYVPKKMTLTISTNGGLSWLPTRRIGPDTAAALHSANVLGDTLDVVYDTFRQIVSTDGGLTWARTSITPYDIYPRSALTPGTLHLTYNIQIGNAREKLYMRSFDLGQTWQHAETLSTVDGQFAFEGDLTAWSCDSIASLVAAWRDEIECAGFVGCSVITTTSSSNGSVWGDRIALTDQPRGIEPALAAGPDGTVVAAWTEELSGSDFHVAVRMRKAGGSTWCPIIDLTPSPRGGSKPDVAVSSTAMHVVWTELVGGNQGTFRIFYRRGHFTPADVKERRSEIPLSVTLYENYPNPFNSKTEIRFRITDYGLVHLKVYDVLGREMATLVNERKDAGEHTVGWNAGGLPSGVYYYRLFAGDRTKTKKALLIR
jgi:hypothetical protein